MSLGGYRHTLHNVSDELDWRPLRFVDRLPPAQVCSACRLVGRRTGSLACGHFLCGPCYQQQRELGDPVCCPFDSEACLEESVQWREFPAENLLERRVYCWNKDNGCSIVLTASELSRHFRLECSHHVVTCPQCSTKILHNSLGLHLRSCTGDQGPIATEGAQGAGDSQQTAELTALKTTLSTVTLQMERQLGDLKGLLEQLSLEGNLQTDQINELSHTINSLQEVQTDRGNALACSMHDLKETLQHDLETVASQSSARHAADIVTVKDAVVETGRETCWKMDLVLHHVVRPQSSHRWTLKGYSTVKGQAMRAGSAECFTDPLYLCHYLIVPGVHFVRIGKEVSLRMTFCLMKGEVDEYLQWPFNRKMRLSVVHPHTGKERTVEGSPDCRRPLYSRPTTPCNRTFFLGSWLQLNDLERDGYVKSDEVGLCFTLLN